MKEKMRFDTVGIHSLFVSTVSRSPEEMPALKHRIIPLRKCTDRIRDYESEQTETVLASYYPYMGTEEQHTRPTHPSSAKCPCHHQRQQCSYIVSLSKLDQSHNLPPVDPVSPWPNGGSASPTGKDWGGS